MISFLIVKKYKLFYYDFNYCRIIKRFAGSGKKAGEILGKAFIRPRSPSPTNLFSTQRVTLLPRSHNRLGSTLLPSSNPNVRGYSSHSIRNPDPLNIDTQAKTNNPLTGKKGIQHPEIVREICDKTDCKSKTCSTHCSTVLETKSVGHATHGTPKISHGKVHTGDKPDFAGTDKQQNVVIYDKPHNTTNNQVEKEPHTTNLKNNTKIVEIIKENAK